MQNGSEAFATILKDVLRVNPKKVTDGDSAQTLKKWNSMTHMKLIARLESTFSVRFELTDVVRVKTIGDLKGLLAKHAVEV